MMANMACTLTMYCGLVLVSVPETGEKYNLLFDAVLVLMNGCVAVYAAIHIAPFRLLATIITGMRKRADKDKRALKRRKTMSLLPSSNATVRTKLSVTLDEEYEHRTSRA